MKCPKCKQDNNIVIDSREHGDTQNVSGNVLNVVISGIHTKNGVRNLRMAMVSRQECLNG